MTNNGRNCIPLLWSVSLRVASECRRTRIHFSIIQLGSHDATLSKSDLLTRVYILAVILSDIAERRRAAVTSNVEDLPGLMADLKIRLETTFVFMPEQKVFVHCLYDT